MLERFSGYYELPVTVNKLEVNGKCICMWCSSWSCIEYCWDLFACDSKYQATVKNKSWQQRWRHTWVSRCQKAFVKTLCGFEHCELWHSKHSIILRIWSDLACVTFNTSAVVIYIFDFCTHAGIANILNQLLCGLLLCAPYWSWMLWRVIYQEGLGSTWTRVVFVFIFCTFCEKAAWNLSLVVRCPKATV